MHDDLYYYFINVYPCFRAVSIYLEIIIVSKKQLIKNGFVDAHMYNCAIDKTLRVYRASSQFD